jgi:hypothetical protein
MARAASGLVISMKRRTPVSLPRGMHDYLAEPILKEEARHGLAIRGAQSLAGGFGSAAACRLTE